MECGTVVNPTKLRILIPDTGTCLHGMTFPTRAWIRFNCLRTGVGRFRSCLCKWGMLSSAASECVAEEQTVNHVSLRYRIHQLTHGLHGLMVLYDEIIE